MAADRTDAKDFEYNLDEQVGFLLRVASQRHTTIFQSQIDGSLTPTQFSTLIRLSEVGVVSQNQLGRLAAMDIATIKGVVDRLKAKGLIQSKTDEVDKRRSVISLLPKGAALVEDLKAAGHQISEKTLAPLTASERKTFLSLLKKIS